jgi:hypothetical protein
MILRRLFAARRELHRCRNPRGCPNDAGPHALMCTTCQPRTPTAAK